MKKTEKEKLFFTAQQLYLHYKERIENIDEVKSYLKTLAERLNIPYQQELDWQWK